MVESDNEARIPKVNAMQQFKIRGQDDQGSGYFGAPRKGRIHNGVDLACESGLYIKSRTHGTVTKIGYPYDPADEKKGHLRYVEVTFDGNRFRYFYLDPMVQVGDKIVAGDVIGCSQDLTEIYTGITQHFHFEWIGPDGEFVDPTSMFDLL